MPTVDKRALTMDVLELLEKYPSAEEQQLLFALLGSFTGEPTSKVKDKRSAKEGKSKETSKGKKSTSSSNSSGSKTPKSETKAKQPEKDEEGLVDPTKISKGKTEDLPNLVQCVLSKSSAAKRQLNASKPRMDHKSIRARVSSQRKQTRRALKAFEALEPGSLNSDSNFPPSNEALGKIKDLVNSVKSFRLVFFDATTAKMSVNIGVDLLKNFTDPEIYENLCVDALEQSELALNKETLFWEDPKGVLDSSLDQGKEAQVSSNPFANT